MQRVLIVLLSSVKLRIEGLRISLWVIHNIPFVMGSKLLVMSNLRDFQNNFLLYATFALHDEFSD